MDQLFLIIINLMKQLSEKIQKSYSNFYRIANENKMQIVKIWHYIPEPKIYDHKNKLFLHCV